MSSKIKCGGQLPLRELGLAVSWISCTIFCLKVAGKLCHQVVNMGLKE